MLSWLSQNLATLLISLALLGIVAAILCSLIKNKKKRTSGCGCSCGSCPMSGSCHHS